MSAADPTLRRPPPAYAEIADQGDADMHAIDLTTRQIPSPIERRVDIAIRVVLVAVALLWILHG